MGRPSAATTGASGAGGWGDTPSSIPRVLDVRRVPLRDEDRGGSVPYSNWRVHARRDGRDGPTAAKAASGPCDREEESTVRDRNRDEEGGDAGRRPAGLSSAELDILAGVLADATRHRRRRAVWLIIGGSVFAIGAIALLAIGQLLVAIAGFALAIVMLPLGIVQLVHPHGDPPLWYGIVGSGAFLAIGVVLVVGGLGAPQAFGSRGVAALPMGIFTLVVSVPVLTVFVVRAIRRHAVPRRRRDRKGRDRTVAPGVRVNPSALVDRRPADPRSSGSGMSGKPAPKS